MDFGQSAGSGINYMKTSNPGGRPMTLGNMRELGRQNAPAASKFSWCCLFSAIHFDCGRH